MPDRGIEFTCANCGGVFAKQRSDEEAMAEYRQRMPEVPSDEPTAVLCDDCAQRFYAWLEKHPEERH
jgi:hypothetical protein